MFNIKNSESIELIQTTTLPYYTKYCKNIHSQNGEDGLIEYFLNKIEIRNGIFVEFGAWDGLHFSNTANLAQNGWEGVFIEGDNERFKILVDNYKSNDKILPICFYVEPYGNNSLDSILAENSVDDVDVLSIDIDGNDYQVWDGVRAIKPKLVVIEYNPTIPSTISYIQKFDPELHFGSSLSAFWKLGQEKGYELVATTDTNAFFLREDFARNYGVPIFQPWEIKSNKYETYFWNGYNGQVKIAGNKSLVWHELAITEDDVQVLPPELQKFPSGQASSFYEKINQFKKRATSNINNLQECADEDFLSGNIINAESVCLSENDSEINRWIEDDGEWRHRLNVNLDNSSIVLDIGGFEGQWASDIYSMYCSEIFVFEPVNKFFKHICRRFLHNPKIKIFNFGLGGSTRNMEMAVDGNASSMLTSTTTKEQVKIVDIVEWIESKDFKCIHLVKINIEGAEYELLERLLNSEQIKIIKHLQIQFHDFVDNAEYHRHKIRSLLSRTHFCKYEYKFIWEGWELLGPEGRSDVF